MSTNKVMLADASVGDAYAEIDLGVDQPDVWVTFPLRFSSVSAAYWIANGQSGQFVTLMADPVNLADEALINSSEWETAFALGGGPPVGGAWILVELHHVNGTTSDLYLDGSLVCSAPDTLFQSTRIVQIGSSFGPIDPTSVVYIDYVKIGTTRGGGDLLDDDFESGTFDAWTTTVGDVSIIHDPFVPPMVYADLPWRVILTDRDQQTIAQLQQRATGKQFVFTLNAPAYHTGQVGSDDVEINRPFPDPDSSATLTNNKRLIYGFRRETNANPPYVCRFGGIVMTDEDEGTDAPTTRYTAYDPWQLLMSRPARDFETGEVIGEQGVTFDIHARASDIAVNLLAQTEAVDGTDTFIDSSDAGLIEETDELGARFTIQQGSSVGEIWQQLCDTGTIDIWLEPMYEPVTAPGKVCRLHIYRKKAVARYDVVMGWDSGPRSLTSVSRMVDGTRLANVLAYITGFQIAGTPQTDAASIAEFGKWWAQQTFPADEDWNKVAALAFAQLQLRKRGQKTLSINPAPERSALALRDYTLGDYIATWASRNLREPLGIDFQAYFDNPTYDPGAFGYQRVYSIPIDVDDNGVERVPQLTTSVDSTSA